MAGLEQNLGNSEDARSLSQWAVAIYEKTFDEDHPNIADCYYNLAMYEKDPGKARSLLEQAFEIAKSKLDLGHSITEMIHARLSEWQC